MSISVTCANCGSSFKVADEKAGKRGKCSHCKAGIVVPQPSKSVPRQSTDSAARASKPNTPTPEDLSTAALNMARENPVELQRQILSSFQKAIEPVQVPIAYRFGIFLVMVLMVALPLLYLSLIAVVCYGIFYHAVNHAMILTAGGAGRGAILALAVYLAPIAGGGILVLFMIKPLFARPRQDVRIRSLTQRSDPILFAFVNRVCEAVSAPQPSRIDVDFEVNASASFRRGPLSMLGNDLVLTIGLPLVAGFNLRQFAGVLGHEFGHFTQGTGMRVTYFIRMISMWFTRVVYERDEWDERLEAYARELDIRISFVLHLARLCVWFTRKILWVFMIVGHTVSGFMLRQMEYDADRHEARLVGSEVFEKTSWRLTLLGIANQGAQADLGEWYKEGRLGDDLPRLIVANIDQIPKDFFQKVFEEEGKQKTGLFDTHPATKDRVASARRENAAGVFHLEIPARVVFSNFEKLSKDVTWDFYRAIFGPQFKPTDMHPVDDLLRRQGAEIKANQAVGRYFQGAFNTLRPFALPPDPPTPPDNPKETIDRLKAARAKMLETRPAHKYAYELFDKADTQQLQARQADVLLQARFQIPRDAFDEPLTNLTAIQRARTEAKARQTQVTPQLEEFEQLAAERLISALRLLYVPQVAARIDDSETWQVEVGRLVPALHQISRHQPAMLQLRNAHAAMAVLLSAIEGNEENADLYNTIQHQTNDLLQQIQTLRREMGAVTYPFDHAKGTMSVGEYTLNELPPSDDLGAIYEAGEEMIDKFPTLFGRLVARLVHVAEQIEEQFGLEPIPEPEDDQAA